MTKEEEILKSLKVLAYILNYAQQKFSLKADNHASE